MAEDRVQGVSSPRDATAYLTEILRNGFLDVSTGELEPVKRSTMREDFREAKVGGWDLVFQEH